MSDNDHSDKGAGASTRRDFLSGSLVTGLAVGAGAMALNSAASAAKPNGEGARRADGAQTTAAPPALGVVHTIDDLRAMPPSSAELVYVMGANSKFGSGGGFFAWDEAEEAADNGSSIIASSQEPNMGRWIRLNPGR